MSRIVIDARRIKSTTGRYIRQLLKYLQKIDNKNEYIVVIHQSDQGSWSPDAKNFQLKVVPYDHYTFAEQLGYAKFLRGLKADLVHFTMPQQPLLYFGNRVTTVHDLSLVKFQNLDKNKIIYTIEQQIFKFLLKNVSRRSRYVITPSNFTKEDLVKFAVIPNKKVKVTYEAAEPIDSKPKPIKKLKDKEFLLYVGNAFPYKNLNRLVDAFDLLKKNHPNLRLVIAGKMDFFHEKLQDYVKQNGIEGVVFLGYVSDEELVWLYQNTVTYVFPSLSEGFGLPGLEAFCFGAPVASSNATCLPEIYGNAAEYFDPENIKSIEETIDKMLVDKDLRQKLSVAGKERLKKYSWEKMAKQTHEIYMKAIR